MSSQTSSTEVSNGSSGTIDLLIEIQKFFEEYSQSSTSQNFICEYITDAYLSRLEPDTAPNPHIIEQELLALTNDIIKTENQKRKAQGDEKLCAAKTLSTWQIAQILRQLHYVIRIAPDTKNTDPEYDLLAMYNTTGINQGTYTTSENEIRSVARQYNTQLTILGFKEILAILRENTPRNHQCIHPDLIAVNNGIVYYNTQDSQLEINNKSFEFKAKKIHPFDPAIIFLSKSRINYVENAPTQVISHPKDGDWDVVSWLDDMFNGQDQEGLTDLIWEIIGAIIRPHVRWGKTAWFYSEQGNNGKGTLCSLMRNLLGEGTYTSIPLADFGKDFALEPLIRANAIIVDENDVGTLIDKAANLKALVTGDVIQINRKYRMAIAFQFFGFMVQCLNEFPKAKDKSESFYRRQLFVPFTKSFTGSERKYIKEDYLQRQEVLEYVLWYAINRAGATTPGNYYQLSEPPATQIVLDEYKETNDPVRAFWLEFRERFTWDLLPFTFLYDLFKRWFHDVSPTGSIISRQKFVSNLCATIHEDTEWDCSDKNRKIRPGLMMDTAEPLIAEYELKNWYSPTYTGSDPNKLCRPLLQPNYRGLRRNTLTSTTQAITSSITS